MDIAIVTGASSGMGKQFALKIDNLGLDEIWGIGLEEDLLKETEQECKTKFRGFALDLTKSESLEKIKTLLLTEKPNIKWLVNASGFGKFARFDEVKVETSMNMIDLNVKALTFLTETCYSYMQSGARIVEFGSVAGYQPVPYIALYGATKAFVYSYSRAISRELKPKGISVTCITPYWTKTRFFDRAVVDKDKKDKVVTKYVCMYKADKVINRAFKDALKRKRVSKYGFVARMQILLVKLLPTSFAERVWLKQQKLYKKYKDK